MIAVWPTGPVVIDIEPISRDYCETCGLQLYPSERVEVTEEAEPVAEDGLLVFGSMTATFCTEHAPQEATA